ncbi:MAG TPA: type IV pilus secretin PilQ [Vicinamibacterales bacterium]|nr:type IV pilus secretin PilQ [Vicinamibacterales bacterium]
MRRRSAIPMIAFALAALVLARDRGLSAASTVPAARLTAISSTADGHRSSLLIEASEPVAYQTSQPDPSTLVVELRNVVAGDYANGFTAAPGSPIRAVAVEHGNSAAGEQVARVRVALTGTVQPRVRSQRNLIFVEVDGQSAPAAAAVAAAPSTAAAVEVVTPSASTRDTRPSAIVRVRATAGATPDPMSALTLNADAPQATVSQDPAVVVGAGARAQTPSGQPSAPAVDTSQSMTRSGGNKAFSGHPVSLDFQGADLRAVLRTFAEISGLNIVIDPSVQGSVDVALRDVPWDQALDIILRANKLGYFVDGTIVRIAPLTVLAEEEKQRRKLGEEQALSGEIKVLTHTLSYAKAEEIKPLLEKSALSQRGTVQFDSRTNTLIISDLSASLTTEASLIKELDTPQPQVEIEARIIQTTSDFARSIGVQWGINGRANALLGNTTPLAFPNNGSLAGRVGPEQGPLGATVPTAVNLGTVAATSALGLALGSVNGSFGIDVALSALEKAGKGKLLSSPRVSTQNNVEAEITQGVQIPVQTSANNTVTVTFKDAALTLRVMPQITASGTVIMRITLENAAPDYSRSVNGIPPIDTQRAVTSVLVTDGETTVIGGIFTSREQNVEDRTPVLHRIPLLGWLFKRDVTNDESRELLIFITPRITKA